MRYLFYEGNTHPHRIGPESRAEYVKMVQRMPFYDYWCVENLPPKSWQIDWNNYHAIFFIEEEHATMFKLTWDKVPITLEMIGSFPHRKDCLLNNDHYLSVLKEAQARTR